MAVEEEQIPEPDAEIFNHLLERNEVILNTILGCMEDDSAHVVLGCEALTGIQCIKFDLGEQPEQEDMNEMWLNAPGAVFFAQRLTWSNSDDIPPADSWLVTVVIPDKPAIFFAKQLQDELWEPFPAFYAPWFAVSTAAAMREALTGTAVPVPMSTLSGVADAEDLFKSPGELPTLPIKAFRQQNGGE